MITVALIDKHPILRTGLSIFLKEYYSNIVILESSNVTAFHEAYPVIKPNLIILGTDLSPGVTRINYLAKLKEWYRIETVIVFEEQSSRITTTQYLKAGIKGYILKQASLAELALCIENVLNGKHYLCNEAFEVILANNTPKKTRLK